MITICIVLVALLVFVLEMVLIVRAAIKLWPARFRKDPEDYLEHMRLAAGWAAMFSLTWMVVDVIFESWGYAIATGVLGVVFAILWWLIRRIRPRRRTAWRLTGDKTRRILDRIKRKMRSRLPERRLRWVPRPA